MTTEQIAQVYGVPASVLAQPLQRSVNQNLPEERERFKVEVNAELDQFVGQALGNEFTLRHGDENKDGNRVTHGRRPTQ